MARGGLRQWVLSMLGFMTLMFILTTSAVAQQDRESNGRIAAGVVQINVRTREPDLLRPWRLKDPQSSSGSGTIIDGARILTAAHVVEDATKIEVKRADARTSYGARVVQISYPCDLAILSVDDAKFFDGAEPLRVGPWAPVGTTVQALGFPLGGDALAVTEGIVSRYEVKSLPVSREEVLVGQIDAPLNEGASGGPVISDGAIVGVASAVLGDAENVGYVVPSETIRHFIEDVKDGKLDGVPRIGAWWQDVSNNAHRRFIGLDGSDEGGFLIVGMMPDGTGVNELRVGDVIRAIDGVAIGADGTVDVAPGVSVSAEYLLESKQVGQPASLRVRRGGAISDLQVSAKPLRWVIPSRSRRYLVFGGIVFQPLNVAYIQGAQVADHVSHLIRESSIPRETQDLVVLSHFLDHPVNKGYESFEDEVVVEVNGQKVRGLDDLARLLDESKGPFVRMTTDTGAQLVWDLEESRASFEALRVEYEIPLDRNLRD